MITIAAHRRWNGELEVANLTEADLSVPLLVRLAKPATTEADVAEPLGQPASPERAAFRAGLGAGGVGVAGGDGAEFEPPGEILSNG